VAEPLRFWMVSWVARWLVEERLRAWLTPLDPRGRGRMENSKDSDPIALLLCANDLLRRF
jgi:hypothetical protein